MGSMTRMIGRWWPSVLVALAGVVFLVGQLVASNPLVGVVAGVLLLVYAWALSPTFFPRSADLAQARRRAAQGESPVIFWKPGCIYCILLRLKLGAAGRRASWVDSSLDEQARAVVRSVNGGDHTTPTVMFGEQTRTNPDAAWVRSLLR